MTKATITLIQRGDELDMLTEFEGGFNEDNGAHVVAVMLREHAASLMDAKTPAMMLDDEQMAAAKAKYSLPALGN